MDCFNFIDPLEVMWVQVGREWGRYKQGADSSSHELQGKRLPPCAAVAIILSSQKQPSLWPFPLNLPIPFPDLFLLGERLRIIKELHNFPPFLLSLKLYWFTDHKTPATQKEESASFGRKNQHENQPEKAGQNLEGQSKEVDWNQGGKV